MLENEPDTDQTSSQDDQAPSAATAPPRRRRAASRPAGPPATAPDAPPIETTPATAELETPTVSPSVATQAEAPAQAQSQVEVTAPAEESQLEVPAPEAAGVETRPAKRAAAKRPARKTAAKKTVPAPSGDDSAAVTDEIGVEPTAAAPRKRAPRKRAVKKVADNAAVDSSADAVVTTASTDDQSELSAPVAEEVPASGPAGWDTSSETVEATPVDDEPRSDSEPEPVNEADPAIDAESVPEDVANAQAPDVEGTDQTQTAAAEESVSEQAEPDTTQPEARDFGWLADPFAAPVHPATERPAAETTSAASDGDATESSDAESNGDDEESGDGGNRRRRRRRGGRRRRRSGGDSDTSDSDTNTNENDDTNDNSTSNGGSNDDSSAEARTDAPTAAAKSESDAPRDDASSEDASSDDNGKDDGEDSEGQVRRRRRRRRRGEEAAALPDDPTDVVVRVREPRARKKPASDEVTGIQGSTRMEAKRQRRKEGRDAGRRRAPILSEAEFLARRESVNRQMIIRQREDLSQIAVLEDGILVEHYVDRESAASLIGNVYLGRVQNVLPSMEAAFIDIGRGRNAVLYAGEVDWDSFGAEGQNRKVEKVLKSGQMILVQVSKDPVGAKGARLTNHVSIPGRYIVYAPGGHLSGISRKLPDVERKRLKDILADLVGDSASVIVRTAAEGASEEELVRDVNRLKAQWEDIERKVKAGNSPQLLYGEPDLTVRIVRDLFTEDFSELVIQGNGSMTDAYDAIQGYVTHVAPHLQDRIRRWEQTGDVDLFAEYRLDEQIAKALERKVFLPSGGSLVIDRTEAMTVIDVNTGKFTGTGGNLEATVTSNNLEAAEEIVNQLRLRDIGGIIVIDFIDMVLPSNRELLLRRLVECLGRDRTRHQVAEVTSLGLVQMTRKKIGTGLIEAFATECPQCHGRGYELHDLPVDTQKQADGGAREQQRPRDNRPKPSDNYRGGGSRGDTSRNDSGRNGRGTEGGPNGRGGSSNDGQLQADRGAGTKGSVDEPAGEDAGQQVAVAETVQVNESTQHNDSGHQGSETNGSETKTPGFNGSEHHDPGQHSSVDEEPVDTAAPGAPNEDGPDSDDDTDEQPDQPDRTRSRRGRRGGRGGSSNRDLENAPTAQPAPTS